MNTTRATLENAASLSVRHPGLKDLPKGVFLLFSTEFWERFSYYGMLGLLVLFLVAPASSGGFGWDNATALRFVGGFMAAIWFAPLIGGWIADYVCGAPIAVVMGCASLAMGNILLAGRAFIPELADSFTGLPVSDILNHPSVSLASAWSRSGIEQSIAHSASSMGVDSTELLSAIVTTYRWISICLVAGLVAMVIGAGLFKSNVSVLMGGLFTPEDRRRDLGFTVFYMGINLGALIAPLVAGTLGERYGWHLGFLAAAAGMLIGLAIFLLTHRRLLGNSGLFVGRNPSRRKAHATNALEWRRVAVIAIFIAFATVFSTGLMQYGGLLNLYASQHINRTLAGLEIPTTWFLMLNPLYIVLFGTVVGGIWTSRQALGKAASSGDKFIAGLVLMALAFGLLAWVASGLAEGEKAHWSCLALFYLILTVGELCIYPVGLALVSRLAPAHWVGVLMGAWLLTHAIGSWIAGHLGALAESIGVAAVFGITATAAAVAAALFAIAKKKVTALAGTTA